VTASPSEPVEGAPTPAGAGAPKGRGVATARTGLLVFSIDGQEYAVPLDPIVEIVAYRRPTSVPGAEPGILGILPLRGHMVTVVDARRRLGLPERDESGATQMIVLRESGELLGLVVDLVRRVAPLAAAEREPLPAALRLDHPELFRGIVRREGGYVLLLDVPSLLKSPR
jgi:purine-binding chemotaxis protein CheW